MLPFLLRCAAITQFHPSKNKKDLRLPVFFFFKKQKFCLVPERREMQARLHFRDMTDVLFLFFASLPLARSRTYARAPAHTPSRFHSLSLSHNTHSLTHTDHGVPVLAKAVGYVELLHVHRYSIFLLALLVQKYKY